MDISFLLILLIIYLLPFIFILSSNKTKGKEKISWVLEVIFISWFAWIFYMLLAPINKKDDIL